MVWWNIKTACTAYKYRKIRMCICWNSAFLPAFKIWRKQREILWSSAIHWHSWPERTALHKNLTFNSNECCVQMGSNSYSMWLLLLSPAVHFPQRFPGLLSELQVPWSDSISGLTDAGVCVPPKFLMVAWVGNDHTKALLLILGCLFKY